MAVYGRLVVPGRFQPPHYGHISTIKYALEHAEEAIVAIGSAQESFTFKNPLTAGERIVLLRKALKSELGSDYDRIYIVPVVDIQMHKLWVQHLRALLPPFEGVVSGNELVLILFEDAGLAALRPPMYKPEICNGTLIRKLALNDKAWWECVPESIREDLETMGFASRIKRIARGNLEASGD